MSATRSNSFTLEQLVLKQLNEQKKMTLSVRLLTGMCQQFVQDDEAVMVWTGTTTTVPEFAEDELVRSECSE